MIKRAMYTAFVLMLLAGVLKAKPVDSYGAPVHVGVLFAVFEVVAVADTTKNKKLQEFDDKTRIKDIPKARRQAKPEKIVIAAPVDTLNNKIKQPRQRRPDGLVRPPEIPRRNNN